MTTKTCRVCGNSLYLKPLLQYHNMPKAAQFMPDPNSFLEDRGIDIEVCQCSGCGLVQLSNDPVPYYREVIRASAFSEQMREFRIKQFTNLIKKYSLQGKKIIEIGCGRGEYLSLLQLLDVDAYGMEYSEESVMECVKNGLKVSKGFIEHTDYDIDHSPFDGFLMLSYLEHLPNPNTILRGIWNNLNDSAIGLVEVPNFDMILQKDLFSEFTADHLTYFTYETFDLTLRTNGFEIIECQPLWDDYIISAIVRKRTSLDLSEFNFKLRRIRDQLQEYLSLFPERDVAVWGAGHQSLAVIALTDIASRIKYVVDSAEFKQGKLTPATHIPIVSPEALHSDPVSAVIIAAAGYSDEIARIVRKKFPQSLSVAILRAHGLEII